MKVKIVSILVILYLIVNADFIRENRKEVVHDTSACLMWQDNNESKLLKMTWEEAIDYCENLVFAGYDDWRLPNLNELFSISEKSKVNPAIKSAFDNVNVSSPYWSSTSWHSNICSTPSEAWSFEYIDGNDQTTSKDELVYVRCVRDKK